MPPRADRATALTVELSVDERAVVQRMKAGAMTDPNLVRVALWSLADHMGVEMLDGVFDLRVGSGIYPRTTRNPKVRQDRHCPSRWSRKSAPSVAHPWHNKGWKGSRP